MFQTDFICVYEAYFGAWDLYPYTSKGRYSRENGSLLLGFDRYDTRIHHVLRLEFSPMPEFISQPVLRDLSALLSNFRGFGKTIPLPLFLHCEKFMVASGKLRDVRADYRLPSFYRMEKMTYLALIFEWISYE